MIKKFIILLLLSADFAFGQGNGLYKFIDDNRKYGFIDKNGVIKINPDFLTVNDFSEGLSFVSKETNKKGYKWICIDTLGNEVFDIKDNFPETGFSEGFARISSFTNQWFIDKKGQKVFNKSFANGKWEFRNGMAVVCDDQLQDYYFINRRGEKVKYMPEGNVLIFKDGLVHFWNKGAYLIDTLGKQIGGRFEQIDDWHEGLIKVRKDNKWGFIDQKGNIVIDFKYGEDDFYNPDSTKRKSTLKIRNISLFCNGTATFQADSLWGIINSEKEILIQPKFKGLRNFSEGLAAATLDGEKWGFIDKTGKFVIKPQFYLADDFKNGLCAVKTIYTELEVVNDRYFNAIINSRGEIVNFLEMHCYQGFKGDLIAYYGGYHFSGGVFYLNIKGEEIIPVYK